MPHWSAVKNLSLTAEGVLSVCARSRRPARRGRMTSEIDIFRSNGKSTPSTASNWHGALALSYLSSRLGQSGDDPSMLDPLSSIDSHRMPAGGACPCGVITGVPLGRCRTSHVCVVLPLSPSERTQKTLLASSNRKALNSSHKLSSASNVNFDLKVF